MMKVRSRRRWCAWVSACVLAASLGSRDTATQERFSSGQNIAPVYEGWIKKADGTFDMYFGYMNRNWVEEPIVPIGPANSFSPGPADRGQPTYFYPRRQEFSFVVNVPADWGPTKELIWTLTVYGKTDKAYGWLKPEWEIDELLIARNPGNQGGRTPEEIFENKKPSITIDPVQPVRLPGTLTLTATVTDDGLPKVVPRRQRSGSLETLSAPPAPVNVPTYRIVVIPRNDLATRWIAHRGPGRVTFDPPGYQVAKGPEDKTSGKTTTTAKFEEPGTYVLRAYAADGVAFSTKDITVTVTKPGTQD